MTRSPTTLAAYDAIRRNGLLSRSRFAVYECLLEHGPLTRNELDHRLSHGSVNPTYSRRLVELERLGVVQRVGTFRCSITGFECDAWDVTDSLPQASRPTRRPSLRRIVEDLAAMKPLCGIGSDYCHFCHQENGLHAPNCVWLRAAEVTA